KRKNDVDAPPRSSTEKSKGGTPGKSRKNGDKSTRRCQSTDIDDLQTERFSKETTREGGTTRKATRCQSTNIDALKTEKFSTKEGGMTAKGTRRCQSTDIDALQTE
ncbi:hypothetical protein PMAYCL1PPCAC_13582, partial [Pristionchus mayeri]